MEVIESAEAEQSIHPKGERKGHRIARIGCGVFKHGTKRSPRLSMQCEVDDIRMVTLACGAVDRQITAERRVSPCFPHVADRGHCPRLHAMREGELGIDGQGLVDHRAASRLQCEQEVHRLAMEFHRAS